MKRWQVKMIRGEELPLREADGHSFVDLLNEAGLAGWEPWHLISATSGETVNVVVWMKREMPEHEWADPTSNKAFADWSEGR